MRRMDLGFDMFAGILLLFSGSSQMLSIYAYTHKGVLDTSAVQLFGVALYDSQHLHISSTFVPRFGSRSESEKDFSLIE